MVNYLSYKDVGQGTSTELKTVQVAPGVRKDFTKYQAEGGWVDSDKIRFRDGRAEKIGGWVSETVQQYLNAANKTFTGVARNILAWAALDSSQYLAVGTNAKLEILSYGQIFDVTPVRTTVTFHTFGTVQGSSIITFTDKNHGLSVGDYISAISQNEALFGISLAGSYKVLTVPTTDTYTVDSGQIATSTTQLQFNSAFNDDFAHYVAIKAQFSGDFSLAFSKLGSFQAAFSTDFSQDFGSVAMTLIVNYLIPAGSVDNANETGYGGGTWNTPGLGGGGYGTPRAGNGGIQLRKWALDTWGEDLIANPSGGTIYHWVKANGLTTALQPLAGAPSQVNFTMVAEPARFIIAFGCNVQATDIFDPLIIRWATQETLTDWVPNQYNTAGEYRLPSGNKIIGAIQTSQEIFVFTDTAVYSMVFLGANDPTNSIFQFTLLGTNISCISPTSMMTLNGAVYWMGLDNFYMYNGVVSIIPTSIGRFIFHQDGEGRYNHTQKEKTFCGINKEFNEIWWLYPRFDETECGHYVKFNYLENVWDIGSMTRTVWLDKGIFPFPYAISPTGTLFSHENGFDDDSQPMLSFIESAYFDIDDGEQLMFVDRIVPDVTMPDNKAIQITVQCKKFPLPENELTTKGPYSFDNTDNKLSIRARGRQMALIFTSQTTGGDFALGKIRIASEIDGER